MNRKRKLEKNSNVNQLAIMGALIALDVILRRFLSINTPITRIGFAFIAEAIAAIVLGPLQAAAVGGIADFIGAIVFPSGPFFPGFTVTAVFTGLLYGLFLQKKVTVLRIVCAVTAVQLVCSLGLNTLWLSILTGSSYGALLSTRLIQALVTGGVQIVTIALLQGSIVLIKRQVQKAER